MTSHSTHTRTINSSSRPGTPAQVETTPATSSHPVTIPSNTLRLRATAANDRHIQWAEDVIDNEGMGKKSSKVCCIYHAPRAVGESSSESDSSSSSDESDSDSEPDTSRARPAGRPSARRPHSHDHNHNHDDECGDDNGTPGGSSVRNNKAKKARRRSPNAYEKMPRRGKGKKPEGEA